MFYSRTLVAFTTLFMSTSSSLFAMDDIKIENNINCSIQKEENSNLKKKIYNIILEHSKNIKVEELKVITQHYLVERLNALSHKSFFLRQAIYDKEHHQNVFLSYDPKSDFLKNLDKIIEKENQYTKHFVHPYFKKNKDIVLLHSGMISGFSELRKTFIENKENFLLKEFSTFYGENSFYHKNSFIEKLKDPCFFKKSLNVFFVERISFDFIKDLYINTYKDFQHLEDDLLFNHFSIMLTTLFPSEAEMIKKGLNPETHKLLSNKKNLRSFKKERNQLDALFQLFKKDEKNHPLPIFYYLFTRFLANYVEPSLSMIGQLIKGEDDHLHVFTSSKHIEKALAITNLKPSLQSLSLSACGLRSFSVVKIFNEKNTQTKHLDQLHFACPLGYEKELNILAREFIKESYDTSILRNISFEKQKIFMSSLQNAMILLGMRDKVSDKNELDETIDLLSSVKYEGDSTCSLEVQQDFTKLEILKNIVLYHKILKKTKDKKLNLTENRLSILEKLMILLNTFKEKNIIKDKNIFELLEIDQWSFPKRLLSPKNQLAEKYSLLQKLGKEEEAEKVYQVFLEQQAFWKILQEKRKKEQPKKSTNQGEIIQQLIELEKTELEELTQQSRDIVEKNRKIRHQPSTNISHTSEMSLNFALKEDKFTIPNNVEKPKTKGEVDLNRLMEKEQKHLKSNIEEKNNENIQQDKEKEEKNPKKEGGLVGTPKDILDTLFLPYYGEIKWKQLSSKVSKNEIETLLEGAGFVLDKPTGGGSHFKVRRKDELNHRLPIPFHKGGRTKAIYLRLLSVLLASEGYYPLDLEDKLKKDGII